jgi:trigger factor
MQVSVETTSQIERRITIPVPAAEIDEAVSARLKDTAKNVRLNGFRQGRVPMDVVRKRYGHDVRNEVVNEVMRERYVRAITDEGLNPAGFPQIEPSVNESGKDLEFVAVMEIYPQVELTSIEGTDIERPVVSVSDADVDEMIDTLRKQNAAWEEVDAAAADGDQVTIDFQGYIDDEPFEGGSAEGHSLVIGSNSFIPGFEEQLIDYDAAVNWGNWQYIAGVGVDPRGGRHFNIEKQTTLYDPSGDYQAKWIDQSEQSPQALDSVDASDWPVRQ